MREPVVAYVGLGANLGDAAQAIRNALVEIDRLPLTRVTQRSSLYRSAPHETNGPDFINAVVALQTGLSAPELLAELQRLEWDAGRQRPYRYAPRTLDLDLLMYGAGQIHSPNLAVPHPRMTERAFVLVPLAEIAPQRVQTTWLQATLGQKITKNDVQ